MKSPFLHKSWKHKKPEFLNRDQKAWREYRAVTDNWPGWGNDAGWIRWQKDCDDAYARRVAKTTMWEQEREALGYTGDKYHWMFGNYECNDPKWFSDPNMVLTWGTAVQTFINDKSLNT